MLKAGRMNDSAAGLSKIFNFRAIGERLGTAGQPDQEQIRRIHDAGYEAVINLALPTSDNALSNEGSLVTSLGMTYIHIPVDFKKPASRDFRTFCKVMESFNERRVFIHCAANMRVSAFVFLYRVLHQHVPVPEAQQDLQAIWQPDEAWTRFIEKELGTSRGGGARDVPARSRSECNRKPAEFSGRSGCNRGCCGPERGWPSRSKSRLSCSV